MGIVQKVDILGVEVSAIDEDMAVSTVAEWVESDAREYVCIRDVHGVIASQDDPELMRIHNQAGLVTPDGMPLVWCGRSAGARSMERVYGPDLLLRICEESIERGWSHYFYGAGPGVAMELADRLTQRFPGLKVVGTHSPPYGTVSSYDLDATATMLNDSGANIVWVGLSSPKQERWMALMRPQLDAQVIVGVGAAFDLHAGRVAQAPVWMRRAGLEWAFRVAVEPRRLWRRYLTSVPRFMWLVAKSRPRLVGVESSTSDD